MLTKNKSLALFAILGLSTASFAFAAEMTMEQTGATMNMSGNTMTMASWSEMANTQTQSFKIDKVDASIEKTITATFTSEVSKDWAVMKVMEDNRISSSIPDTVDTKKVNLVLNDDIKAGSTYTLFLVWETDASMDFTLPETLPTDAILNTITEWDQNIVSIKFVDSKTVEVIFKKDLAGETEFKLLKEVKVSATDITGNTVKMTTEDDLSTSKSYTLTIVTLNDSNGTPISTEDSFYEFNYTAPESTETASGTELNAASGTTASGVENAAAQATELPGTGPKETLIFFAAMLLALLTVLYYRKKIAR